MKVLANKSRKVQVSKRRAVINRVKAQTEVVRVATSRVRHLLMIKRLVMNSSIKISIKENPKFRGCIVLFAITASYSVTVLWPLSVNIKLTQIALRSISMKCRNNSKRQNNSRSLTSVLKEVSNLPSLKWLQRV